MKKGVIIGIIIAVILIAIILFCSIYLYSLTKIKISKLSFGEIKEISGQGFTIPIDIYINNYGFFPVKIKNISYTINVPYKNQNIATNSLSDLKINSSKTNILHIEQKIIWIPEVEFFWDYYKEDLNKANLEGNVLIKDLKIIRFEEKINGNINISLYLKQYQQNSTKSIVDKILEPGNKGVNIIGM